MRVNTVKKINSIPLIIGSSVVFLLSILFLVLSFTVLLPNSKIPENYEIVEANITQIDEMEYRDSNGDVTYEYHVYIEYTDKLGEKHNAEYGSYSSSMKENDKVNIHVNPNNYDEFIGDTSINYVFPILSGIFAIASMSIIVVNIKKLNEMKKGEEKWQNI